MEFVNPYPKTSKDHWIEEAKRRQIVLTPEDDKLAEIKNKVENFDLDYPNFFGTVEKAKVEIKGATIKILVPAGVRHKGVRLEEETEVEILEKEWEKYSHVATKVD